MARVVSKSIIDCRLSGSIGDKVYYVVNGIQYSRSKPTKMAKPKTESQLDHQARFRAVIKFLQPLKDFLREGFKIKAGSMSAFNAAMSYTYLHALSGSFPDYRIDYSKVLVSCGPACGALNPEVNSLPEGKIEFQWQFNAYDFEARGDDKAMVLVYNPSKQEVVTVLRGNFRVCQNQVIALPSHFKGDEVQCWISFQNASQSMVSDSRYVGSVVVR